MPTNVLEIINQENREFFRGVYSEFGLEVFLELARDYESRERNTTEDLYSNLNLARKKVGEREIGRIVGVDKMVF